MMETFSFIVGVCAIVLSILTIVVLVLLRNNVINILKKDSIIFDQNYELKKSAILKAMDLMDSIENKSYRNLSSVEYRNKVNNAYNDLLCVVSDGRVAEVFYTLATNPQNLTGSDFAKFKIACRKDLGFSVKHIPVEKLSNRNNTSYAEPEVRPTPNPAPIRPQPIQQPNVSQPVNRPTNPNAQN